jgi:tetratricopeptide (TPR) repeat protein
MENDGPSFWAEIKKYEDTLEREPNSYCFAPLSELYRKLGMVDDAIIVARRGCDIHPEYVGGYMALGRAYLEKGMHAESREALEKVIRVTPENLLAQRILSKVYMDLGETAHAEKSLKVILAQNPDDSESQMLLQSLIRTSGTITPPLPDARGENEDIPVQEMGNYGEVPEQWEEAEDLIELQEWDIVEEFAVESPPVLFEEKIEEGELDINEEMEDTAEDLSAGEVQEEKDPLTTVTLAELYVSQGFTKRALTIFRELLEADPENLELKNRILALKQEIDIDEECAREHSLEADSSGHEIVESEGSLAAALSSSESELTGREVPDLENEEARDIIFRDESRDALATPTIIEEEPDTTIFVDTTSPAGAEISSSENGVFTGEGCHPAGSQEQVIRTLEIWLENIKRRR